MPMASADVTIGATKGPGGIECGNLFLVLNGGLHKLSMPSSMAAASVAAMGFMLFAACGGGPTPTTDSRIDQSLNKLDQLTERVRILERKIDAGTVVSDATLPTSPIPAASALPTPTLTQLGPAPTPNPDNPAWIQRRLKALVTLYNLTDSGDSLLRSLDLRQMQGDPGFFGSYGFKEWAGVGEAKPTGVMHEVSHSYWGGFPVQGLPELSWEISKGDQRSTAMERYHADILTFMAQPPDDYELFRQRLRNLPSLSSINLEPLFHNLEADLVYGTGGDLALVPPILRKYWSRFLNHGPFGNWHDAVAWYQSLPDEDRTEANKYLGFEHLDLRFYDSPASSEDLPNLVDSRRDTLAEEERQRLYDLADQFDLLLGGPQKEENFQFWRSYLRDKVGLQRRHQDYLVSLDQPRAADLATALEFLVGLSGLSPQEQAQGLAARLASHPFLVNFLPFLDNPTLLELFSAVSQLPGGPTLEATASFVERLERFSVEVDRILGAGHSDSRLGAAELEEFLSQTDFEQKDDLRLFFDLFREKDPDTAGRVIQALAKETIHRLMKPVPTQLRFALTPEELLGKLDITPMAPISALKQGLALLINEPSGNFIIDEPFLDRMYEVIATRGQAESGLILQLLQESTFPLEGFIRQEPQASVALLDSDLEATLRLVRQSDPVLSPPARIIYQLIHADPVFAAGLVQALDEQGEAKLVIESLVYLAYDQSRLERAPELPISLDQDGMFLRALLHKLGSPGLVQRLSEAFGVFAGRAATGEVSPDFLTQYQATLKAAAATLQETAIREELINIVEQVGQKYPIGR